MADWPIGTPEERKAAPNRLPGYWTCSNFYLNWYLINIKLGIWNWHTGADLNNNHPKWNSDYHSPIYAVADGVVVFAGRGGGTWGHIIVTQHTVSNITFYNRVGHVENVLVKTGDWIKEGQQICNVGNGDGVYAGGGEHLHWDISLTKVLQTRPNDWPGIDKKRVLTDYVDPIKFIAKLKTGQPIDDPTPELQPHTGSQMVTHKAVRLRTAPDTASRVVYIVPAGATAVVISDSIVDSDYWQWVKVKYLGLEGYMAWRSDTGESDLLFYKS